MELSRKRPRSISISSSSDDEGEDAGGARSDCLRDAGSFEDGTKRYHDASKDAEAEHQAFSAQFTQITRLVHVVSEKVQEYVRNVSIHHAPTLNEHVERLAAVPSLEHVRVALIGNPGTGKSSLINSLLDTPDIAMTGASGSACTNVAVEFSSASLGQSSKYLAEVHFHGDGLEKFITDLVEDFRGPLFGRIIDEEEEASDDTSTSQINQASQKAQENAFQILRGLMARHPIMGNEHQLWNKLSSNDMQTGQDATALTRTIVQYVRDMIQVECNSDGACTARVQANSAETLNLALRKYTTEMGPDTQERLWPIVKLVKIFIRGCTLLDYITIADLPGINDDNQIRSNATWKYIETVDVAWIVCRIQRAISDGPALESLAMFNQRLQGKVALICTFSDAEAKDNLLVELEGKVPAADSDIVRGKITESKKAARNVEMQKKAQSGSDRKKEPEQKKRVRKMIAQAEEYLKKARLEVKLALMQLRVKHVRRTMRSKFPGLRVIGVSNELYSELCSTAPEDHFNCLKPGDTGIEELRVYSRILPSERFLIATRNFYRGPILDFKDAVLAITQDHGATKMQSWTTDLRIDSNKITLAIKDYFDELRSEFKTRISDSIVQRKSHYISKASVISETWQHPPITYWAYRKFGRNGGVLSFKHPGKEKKFVDWNVELAGPVFNELAKHWTLTRTRHEISRNNLIDTARAVMLQSAAKCGATFARSNFATEVQQMITRQTENMKNVVEEDHDQLRDEAEQIYFLLRGKGGSSYIARNMKDVYHSISQERGEGMKRRMYAMMRYHLQQQSHSFVDDIATFARQDFVSACTKHQARLKGKINNIVKNIGDNIEAMLQGMESDGDFERFKESLLEFYEKGIRFELDELDELFKRLERQHYAGT